MSTRKWNKDRIIEWVWDIVMPTLGAVLVTLIEAVAVFKHEFKEAYRMMALFFLLAFGTAISFFVIWWKCSNMKRAWIRAGIFFAAYLGMLYLDPISYPFSLAIEEMLLAVGLIDPDKKGTGFSIIGAMGESGILGAILLHNRRRIRQKAEREQQEAADAIEHARIRAEAERNGINTSKWKDTESL